MPVLASDIKLAKSTVMLDVPEGGGPPSPNIIADGSSNEIFDDISEAARAGGQVSCRKVHAVVHTDDTDGVFGGNAIIADPPNDPNVSVTMFTTEETFDRRLSAISRVEAYLNKGVERTGFLFENHISGQRVIQIFQRPTDETPNISETIVLTYDEGLSTQKEQYVRITAVSVVIRLFYDEGEKKDYPAAIVTCDISDVLRYDFKGSPPARSFMRKTDSTKIRETTVADAGSYVGVVPLVEPVGMGDFSVKGSTIYTQLVPNAQIETPITDSRPTQQSYVLVPSGDSFTQVLTLAFTTTQNLFIGGMVLPGSLTIVRGGVTLTDSGGELLNGSSQVGIVDYDNGVCQLTTNVWGTSGGAHTVTYTPSSRFGGSYKSIGIPITQEGRSISYVFNFSPIASPRTVTLSYMVARKWYVLREKGNGQLRGSDAAYGAGTYSFITGTLSVSLGALPDVGSSLIIQWIDGSTSTGPQKAVLQRMSRWSMPMNTSGIVGNTQGAKAIVPSGLTITWMGPDNNGKSAVDNGYGALTGDAQGSVDYSQGIIWWSPNLLPAKTTIVSMDINGAAQLTASNVPIFGGYVAGNLAPRSLYFEVGVSIQYTGLSFRSSGSYDYSYASKYGWGSWKTESSYGHSYSRENSVSNTIVDKTRTLAIRDNGAGVLYYDEPGYGPINVGTVDYVTGIIEMNNDPSVPTQDMQGPVVSFSTACSSQWDSSYNGEAWRGWYEQGYSSSYNSTYQSSWQERWDDCYSALNASRKFIIGAQSISVRYRTVGASQDSLSVEMIALAVDVDLPPEFSLGMAQFSQGGKTWFGYPTGSLQYDVSPTTGAGTVVGELLPSIGKIMATTWPSNTSPVITNWRASTVGPEDGPTAPGCSNDITFRTATAPIRPGSFQILGNLIDGTSFSVSADLQGKINGTRVVGTIDYEVGLVRLWFIKKIYDADYAAVANFDFLGIAGLTYAEVDLGRMSTLRYNAVSYTYLPLDADLLGIDPVRLPSDGRVPIFRVGSFAVVGNTQITQPQTVFNSQTITTGRERLSRVRVLGANDLPILTGYTHDLDAGTVTFNDVAGYSQPVRVEHRIEDMGILRDVQINGDVTFTRAITHAYPANTSYLSSALMMGDLRSRVSVIFDQGTWTGVWSDILIGSEATAGYNSTVYPIEVTNAGAITERWFIRFTSTTVFEVVGEHIGIVAVGNTGVDAAPINPVTGVPYFLIRKEGWGSGWGIGNILRINTVGAQFPIWVVRTVQQGPETITNDSFTLLIRGDVDAP